MWQIPIELRQRMPEIPMICDPSHIGGRRDLIQEISQKAYDLNFDGLIIETHCNPDKALSDAKQQVTPEKLNDRITSYNVCYTKLLRQFLFKTQKA